MTVAQARAFESLAASHVLELPAHTIDRDFLARAFGRSAPLAVEIGFGNGAALTAFAAAHPAWNWVGVDVYRPGIGALLLACAQGELANVRIAEAEALGFLRQLEPASVRRLHVFFPDPWPKKRHHKRRLVNAAFASAAAASLEPGAMLALATDWAEYAAEMVGVLDAQPALEGGVTERLASRPPTSFEVKGLAGGRRVVDLAYRRRTLDGSLASGA